MAEAMDEEGPVLHEVPEEEEPIESIHLKIQNVVGTVFLDTQLDLARISQAAKNAEYNPTRFQAVIVRLREPRTTALIFASGKMIVTGAKKVDDCQEAARKYVSIVQRIGFPAKFTNFKIQNITATCDLGFPIRLEGFLYANAANATYEPELFPGLVYRMANPKVVMLIFVSGKVVLTGAKDPNHLSDALDNIYSNLLEFRKKNVIISTKKT